MTNTPPLIDAPTVVDLAGLPEAVVRQVKHLVEEARRKQSQGATPGGERPSLMGCFAHLGMSCPKDELDQDQREAWAGFPRDFPEPAGRSMPTSGSGRV